jgi:hypothetical protein
VSILAIYTATLLCLRSGARIYWKLSISCGTDGLMPVNRFESREVQGDIPFSCQIMSLQKGNPQRNAIRLTIQSGHPYLSLLDGICSKFFNLRVQKCPKSLNPIPAIKVHRMPTVVQIWILRCIPQAVGNPRVIFGSYPLTMILGSMTAIYPAVTNSNIPPSSLCPPTHISTALECR